MWKNKFMHLFEFKWQKRKEKKLYQVLHHVNCWSTDGCLPLLSATKHNNNTSVLLPSIWPPSSPMRRTDGRHRWRTCRSWLRVRCWCCSCSCCTPVLVVRPLTHLLSTCSSGSNERWQWQGPRPPNGLHSERWAPLFFLSVCNSVKF